MPRKYLYIIVGGVLLFVGWRWYKHRQAASAGKIANPATPPAPNAAAAGA